MENKVSITSLANGERIGMGAIDTELTKPR
jgi:hypothetical protein